MVADAHAGDDGTVRLRASSTNRRFLKTIVSLALIPMFGLLGSCTINPHSMDMTQAVQSAKTRSDHESLAKHYEDAAKEMQAKAAEHKKMLANTRHEKVFMGSKLKA
jgi:hypothetical protein